MSSGGTNTIQTQSAPPAQFLQAYTNVVDQAQQAATTPYQPYPGNLVAPLSPDQLTGISTAENAQGIANPYINAAAQYMNNATRPILSSIPTLNSDTISGLGPSALNYINQAAGPSVTNAANTGASGILGAGNTASGTTMNAANAGASQIMGAAGTGANGILGASQAFNPASINQFVSPYTQQVVNATQAQFNNQNAQAMQGLDSNAIASGAWNGDRAGVAQGILGGQQQLAQAPVIAGLENTGYQTGVQSAETAAGQQLQGATAAGQLGMQGATAAGQLGLQGASTAGQFGLQGATGSGQMGLQGATSQAQLQGQAAQQQIGLLGQQQNLELGANEANSWLNSQVGFGMAGLGTEAQNTTLTGANALMGAGGLEQQQAQESLNVPYEQYTAAQAYPYQNLGWLSGIASGVGSNAGGGSSTTSPAPSGISQALGGVASGVGILGNTGAFGSGGYLTGLFGSGAAAGAADTATSAAAASFTAADSAGSFVGNAASDIPWRRGGGIPGRAEGGVMPPVPATSPGAGMPSAAPPGAGMPSPVSPGAGMPPSASPGLGMPSASSPGAGMPSAGVPTPTANVPKLAPPPPGTKPLIERNSTPGFTASTPANVATEVASGISAAYTLYNIIEGIASVAAAAAKRGGAIPSGIAAHRQHDRTGIAAANDDARYHEPMRAAGGGMPVSVSLAHGSYAGSPDVPKLSGGDLGGGSGMVPQLPIGPAGGGISGSLPPSLAGYLHDVRATQSFEPPKTYRINPAPPPPPAAVTPTSAIPADIGGWARGGIVRRDDGGDIPMDLQGDLGGSPDPEMSLAALDPGMASWPTSGAPLGGLSIPRPPSHQGNGPPPAPAADKTAPQASAPVSAPMADSGAQGIAAAHHDNSPWDALMYAGLGIMGGRSPNAMVNIGEGAMQGLKLAHEEHLQQDQQDSLNAYRQNSAASLSAYRQLEGQLGQQKATETSRHDSADEDMAAKRFAASTDEAAARLKIEGGSLDERQRHDQESESQGRWIAGMGADDDGNQVAGTYFAPRGGGDPVFHPGVTTAQTESLKLRQDALNETKKQHGITNDRAGQASSALAVKNASDEALRLYLGSKDIHGKPTMTLEQAEQRAQGVRTSAAPAPSQGAAPAPVQAPPPGAIALMKKNPALAPQFIEKYGADAYTKVFGAQ